MASQTTPQSLTTLSTLAQQQQDTETTASSNTTNGTIDDNLVNSNNTDSSDGIVCDIVAKTTTMTTIPVASDAINSETAVEPTHATPPSPPSAVSATQESSSESSTQSLAPKSEEKAITTNSETTSRNCATIINVNNSEPEITVSLSLSPSPTLSSTAETPQQNHVNSSDSSVCTVATTTTTATTTATTTTTTTATTTATTTTATATTTTTTPTATAITTASTTTTTAATITSQNSIIMARLTAKLGASSPQRPNKQIICFKSPTSRLIPIQVSPNKKLTFTSFDAKTSQSLSALSSQTVVKTSLVCATKSMPTPTPILTANFLAAQLKSKQALESLNDNVTPKPPEKVAAVRKRSRDTIVTPKSEDTSAEPRVSKRVRRQYQPFQSPESLAVMLYSNIPSNVSLKSGSAKKEELDDNVVIYNRGEFLAVRNEKDDFFICRTYQNVYKNSHKFKIQWFNNENTSVHNKLKDVYMPDFFDRIDFECVLTNLTVKRVDKDQYRLPPEEKQRTINILRSSINREKGIIDDSPNSSQVLSDGIDVSIVGKAEEKELLEKISSKRVKQQNKTAVKNKKVKTETKSGVKKKELKPIKKVIKRKTLRLSKAKPISRMEVKRDVALNTKAKFLSKRSKLVSKGDSKVSNLRLKNIIRGKSKVSPINKAPHSSRSKSLVTVRKSNGQEKSPIKATISPVNSVSSRTPNSRAIKTNNLKVKSRVTEKSLPKRNTKSTNVTQKLVSKEIKDKKVKQNELKEKSRISERVRLHYQPFQSSDTLQQTNTGTTTPTTSSNTKALTTSATKNVKEDDDDDDGEPVIYNKGEFLAVRNEENSFFICRTFQNVYKNSHKFRIQWFNEENDSSVFTASFYDQIDFECILTNLTLNRLDKNQYSLPLEEKQRTMSILQKAINMQKGILPQTPNKVTADGVDVSVVGRPEEKKLLKKISSQTKAKKEKSAPNKSIKETKTVIAKKTKATTSGDETEKPKIKSAKNGKSAPEVATTPRRSLRQASSSSSSSPSSSSSQSPKSKKPGLSDVVEKLRTRIQSSDKPVVEKNVTARKAKAAKTAPNDSNHNYSIGGAAKDLAQEKRDSAKSDNLTATGNASRNSNNGISDNKNQA